MHAKTAYQTLLRSPKSFLQTRVVSINGGSLNGTCDFEIGSQKHNLSTGFEKYLIGEGDLNVDGETHAFKASNLRMIGMSEAFDHTAIPGFALKYDHVMMLTSQLSGCCFCFAGGGSNLVMAHVQPGGTRGTGHQLQNDIKTSGRFDGLPNLTVKTWGVDDYGQGCKASVIAVCATGAWKIYGQVQDCYASRVIRVDEIL